MTPLHIHTVSHGRITYPPPPDICYGDLVRLRNTARRCGLDAATQCAQLTAQIADFFRPRGVTPAEPTTNQQELFA